MFRIHQIIVLLISLICLTACKKTEKEIFNENVNLKISNNNVKPYELVELILNENLQSKYTALFGGKTIDIIKTSDSTLTFFVPEVKSGLIVLKFELGDLKFNVSNIIEVNSIDLVQKFSDGIDARIGMLKNTSLLEKMEVDSLIKYKSDVTKLFNSMSKEQQRQTALFYEANKEVFVDFSNKTFENLNASTTINSVGASDFNLELLNQSDCPKTNFMDFYGCTAENLSISAIELKKVSKQFLKMIGYASVMAGVAYGTSVLGPAAWGITAVGISLPLGTAGFMFFTELWPAFLQFKSSLLPFLKVPWIFSKAIFETVVEMFLSEVSTNLNLAPKFRTINSRDNEVNQGCNSFINAFAALEEAWSKLVRYFGDFPSYNSSEKITSLTSSEIIVSNISNSNVQLVSSDGQSLKFKSISGKDEKFTYNVKVLKQGFVTEKILTATVKGPEVNYKLEIGDYNPDYSKIKTLVTLSSGDSLITPNNVIRMVRLLLNGVPVKVGYNGLGWEMVNFGKTPTSSSDIKIANYGVNVYDYTNSKTITVPLNVTLTNSAYSLIVNKTYFVQYFSGNIGGGKKKIIFHANGTYDKYFEDGSLDGSGGYSFVAIISPNYVICPTYIINKEIVGCIYLPQETMNIGIPNYFIIYADETLSGNSNKGCNDSYERWEIK